MAEKRASGRIVKVAGPVVDAEFPPDALPEILHAVEMDITLAGTTKTVLAEVAQHVGGNTVRAVALAPTDGLTRGTEVRNTGAPISVPVGDQVLLLLPVGGGTGLEPALQGVASEEAEDEPCRGQDEEEEDQRHRRRA